MGDFYVYYTHNEKGEAVVPRIAIRMEKNSIGEVRGVAENQNIEPEVEEIVEQKLNEFPDKDRYKKKVSDMKKLTEIYNKFKNTHNLTREELRFLYETDGKIEGFGYEKDPRIEELLKNRNAKKDLSIIYSCNEEQIGTCKDDLEKELVVYYGNLDFNSLKTAKGLVLPEIVIGALDLRSLKTAEGLKLPKYLNGDLWLKSLETTEGLKLPETITGYLNLSSLKTAEGLKLPKYLNGDLCLNSLETVEDLKLPEIINGRLSLCLLKTAKGLVFPKKINGDLHLWALETLDDLILPERFQKINLANRVVVTPENVHEYVNQSKTK